MEGMLREEEEAVRVVSEPELVLRLVLVELKLRLCRSSAMSSGEDSIGEEDEGKEEEADENALEEPREVQRSDF